MLPLILKVFAFVCFFLATLPIAAPQQPRLVAAGLAFWVGSELFTGGSILFNSHP
jgi:hypothetical protein